MKKMLSLLIALVMVLSMIPAAFAAETIITSQPVDVVAPRGSYAEFSVVAEGATSYQWQYRANESAEWKNCADTFSGVKSADLKVFVKSAREGYQFRCVVKAGDAEYISNAATLTTTSIFAAGPVDETVKLGSRANFTFELAEGVDRDSVKILWQYHIPGQDPNFWPNCTPFTQGYNTTNLNVIAAEMREGFQYRVYILDAEGNRHYSSEVFEPAVLSVDVPSPYAITEQPADAVSMNGGKVTFHVETQGEGLKYQWYYHRDINKTGGEYYWVQMGAADAKTNTLSVYGNSNGINRDGWYYKCEVTDANGYIFTTRSARLWGTTAGVTENPQDYYGPVGGTATYSVTVAGEYESVAWQFSSNGGKTYNASSATVTTVENADGTTTYTIKVDATAARNGYLYRIVMKDNTPPREMEDGVTVGKYLIYSEPGALIIDSGNAVEITTNPESVTAEDGTTATFTGAATGDGVTYQWYVKAADADEWFKLVGETGKTLTVDAIEANNGKSYKLVATDAKGNVADSSAATLTVEYPQGHMNNPHMINVMGVPYACQTGEVSAGATYYASINNGFSAPNMVIENANVNVIYNGETYTPVDGVVTVPLAPCLRMPNNVEIVNKGAEAASYTLNFSLPVGSMENPAIIEDITSFEATQAEGDNDGYWMKWTAPEAGILKISANGDFTQDFDLTVTHGNAQKNLAYDADDFGQLTFNVAEGDELIFTAAVLCEYVYNEDTWDFEYDEAGNKVVKTQYPAGTVYVDGQYQTGSEDHPYTISVDDIPGTATTPNSVAAASSDFYMIQGGGVIMTVAAENTVINYNGDAYAPVDGVITIQLAELNFWAGITSNVIEIVNNGTEAAAYELSFAYPAGIMENPAELVIGENTATIAAGSQGYYYTWTAEKDGTLTITMPAGDWTYTINNLTAGAYGDTQWSDSDPVVNVAEIAVSAGDEIQIIVNTYDPEDMWNNPAGNIVVNASFEADVVIEEDVTNPDDGEE